jgi:hypothetical protein
MSQRNGDRARFHRERHKKILQRMRTRELHKALTQGAPATGAATEKEARA